MEITQEFTKLLMAEMEQAVQSIAQKHGVKIRRGNSTYDSTVINAKFVVTIDDPTGMSSPEARSWRTLAKISGYDPELLGKEVQVNGQAYRILGLNTRSEKFPILALRVSDGKRYKLTDKCVKLPESNLPRLVEVPAPRLGEGEAA